MRLERINLQHLKEDQYHFLLPIGSTEQHGSFAPFGADTFILDEILRRVEQSVPEVVLLPTLPYSCSAEHEGFKGSVWISESTLEIAINEIRKSLQNMTKSFSVLSWHGGNDIVLEKYAKQFSGVNVLSFDDEQIDEATRDLIGGPIDDHAGNTEISMLLAISDDLAEVPPVGYKKSNIPENPFATGRLIDAAEDGIADKHPEWVVSKSIGEKLIDMYANKIVGDLQFKE